MKTVKKCYKILVVYYFSKQNSICICYTMEVVYQHTRRYYNNYCLFDSGLLLLLLLEFNQNILLE